jgi:predicted ATPase
MGDGVAAVFASAPDAVAAAFDVQCELASDEVASLFLRARMGLHTDEGRLRAPGEYVNRPLNRCARLMAVAHGGQVLLSDATTAVVRRSLPDNVDLVDLGVHQLRDLADSVRVFQLLHPSLRAEFPPLRSLTSTPGNLPRQLTTFIGRDVEMERISALVRERPIVTLTGVGGVGKTRLALQVAADVTTDFPDGAWLCELAAVTDPSVVWEAVATSLGVQPNPTRALADTVIEYLTSRRLLIVFDNCEHLLVEVAQVVDAICRRCQHVTVLATSREGLALAGEQLVAVPALGLPDDHDDAAAVAEADAVHLFCDRARDANSDFVLTEANAAVIGHLCRRLDGIPLAIELAAARIRSLPPEELVARLDQRFRLLTRGSRAALERHQTLRNTIDWSYNLLDADEQVALNRLSVFAGGCDLAGAEAIISDGAVDAIDVLGQLVDKSLVLVDETGNRARYRMLEMIRQYAQERLEQSGETATVRRRHAEYFVRLSEAAGPHLRRREQLQWVATLIADAENLRAALDWAVEEGSAEQALRLVAPLMVTGIPIGWSATNWAELAQSIPGAETHVLYPVVVAFAALGAALHGDLELADELATRALTSQAALGTNHMWVLTAAGVASLFRSEMDEASRYATAWEDAARQAGDPYEIAQALILRSATRSLEPREAAALADQAIDMARECGVPSALLYAIVVRANYQFDDRADLLEFLAEGIEVATQLGDSAAAGGFISMRGWLAGADGDWTTTLRAAVEGIHQQLDTNLFSPFPGIFGGAAIALGQLGDYESAAVLRGFSEAHMFATLEGAGFAPAFESLRVMLTEELGADRFSDLAAHGAALDATEAAAYLLAAATHALET